MIVRSRASGRLGTIPDDRFDPQLFEQTGEESYSGFMGGQPPPQPSTQDFAQRFGQNVASDVGENIMGVLKFPQYLAQQRQAAPNLGVMGSLAKIGLDVGKGMAKNYAGYVTNPETGEFDMSQLPKRAFDRPVSTLIDAAVIGDIVGGVKRHAAAKTGGTQRAMTEGAKTDLVAKAETVVEKAAKDAVRVKESEKALNTAARIYSNSFTIPSKIAKRINPVETTKELIKYNATGNLEQLKALSGEITGSGGLFSKMTRDALAGIEGEIAFDKVLDSTTMFTRQKLLIPKDMKVDLAQDINSMINVGGEINKMGAFDAFETVKALEKKGYWYKSKSTDLTPNPLSEQIGDVYLNAADELESAISQSIKNQDILTKVKNAENTQLVLDITKKYNLSPLLLEKFREAKTFEDLRGIQKPFVRLDQMIDVTESYASSPLPQSLMFGASKIGTAIATGGLSQVPRAVASLVGGPMIQPLVQTAATEMRTPMATNLATGIYGTSQKLAGAKDAIVGAGKTIREVSGRPETYAVGRATSPPGVPGTAGGLGGLEGTEPEIEGSMGTDGGAPSSPAPESSQLITPGMVSAAYLTLPKDQAEKIKSAFEAQQGSGGTQSEQEKAILASTGLRDLSDLRKMLGKGNSILPLLSLIPGKPGARKYSPVVGNLIDVLSKLRTGKTANLLERLTYIEQLPFPGDSPEVVKYKLDRIETELKSWKTNTP